jgi:hypothetical protein
VIDTNKAWIGWDLVQFQAFKSQNTFEGLNTICSAIETVLDQQKQMHENDSLSLMQLQLGTYQLINQIYSGALVWFKSLGIPLDPVMVQFWKESMDSNMDLIYILFFDIIILQLTEFSSNNIKWNDIDMKILSNYLSIPSLSKINPIIQKSIDLKTLSKVRCMDSPKCLFCQETLIYETRYETTCKNSHIWRNIHLIYSFVLPYIHTIRHNECFNLHAM